MRESALQEFASEIWAELKVWLQKQDRLVVIAFVFALVPFSPTLIIALLLSVGHLLMIKASRLDRAAFTVVLVTIFFAVANLAISLWVADTVLTALDSSQHTIFTEPLKRFMQIWAWVLEALTGRPRHDPRLILG